jgi:2-oxoglutarate decarboxylase
MAYNGKIDWAFGELLALGSLVADGTLIRLSGQDTRRGTFSQRHSVLIDRKTGAEFTPLQLLTTNEDGTPTGGKFLVYDSALSSSPRWVSSTATRWATRMRSCCGGQFGDFVNGAQRSSTSSSSGEAKWGQRSDVVLLLPHGHEVGRHTSGRIERFLQVCAGGR